MKSQEETFAPPNGDELADQQVDCANGPPIVRSPTQDKRSIASVQLPLTLQFTGPVLEQIYNTIGRMPAEQGGALGGSRANGIVTHFQFDHSAQRSAGTYSPDHHVLNRLFKKQWNPAGVNLLGFVHSHPPGILAPSDGDLHYARRILAHIPELETLLLPIVISEANADRYELIPYVVVRSGDDIAVILAGLEQVESAEHDMAVNFPVAAEVQPPSYKSTRVDATKAMDHPGPVSDAPAIHPMADSTSAPARKPTKFVLTPAFSRVEHAYDLPLLAFCRVIAAGAGGATSFFEDMARAGVGEFVIIDPDAVAETNIATQQVYRHDIGRNKVTCIAERILEINPNARIVPLAQSLDEINDIEFAHLARQPITDNIPSPHATLLCGFTDDFYAQARVNRLALHLGLPSLSAQVYREGRGAEIVFTYPGVTPACQRCILSSRYRSYLEEGFRNDVTSHSTPIFATSRLNALKGFVAMAILHHGTDHARWGGLLARIGHRNLLQIRMDPDLATSLGLGAFDRVFGGGDSERIFFDEVVWLPQEPENPATGHAPCPDCEGTGDLRQAMGTFADTRVARPVSAQPAEQQG